MNISYVFLIWLILETKAQFPFFGRSYNGPRAVEVPRMYSGRGIGQYPRREAGAIQTSDRRAVHGGLAPSYPQDGFRYRQSDGYDGDGVGARSAYSGRTQDYGQRMDNGYDRRAPYSQRGNGYVNLAPSSWRESGGRGHAQGRFPDPRGSSLNGRMTTNSHPRSYDNRDSFSNSDSFRSRPLNTFGRGETFQRQNSNSEYQGDRTAANPDSRYSNRPNGYQSNTNTAYSRDDYRNALPQRVRNGNQYSRYNNHQRPVQRQTTNQNVDPYRNSRGWHQQSNRELPQPGANQPQYRDNQPRIRDNLYRPHDNLPRTRDNQPLTRDNLPRTRDIQPRFRDSQPRTRDIQPRIRDIQPRIRDSQPRTRDSQPRFRQHGQHNVQREWPTGGRPQSTINQRQTQQVASNYRRTINEPLYGRSVWRRAKSATPAVNQPFAGQSRWQSTGLNSRTGHSSLRTPNIDTLVREVDNSFPRFRGVRNEVFQYRTAVQRTPGGTGSSRRGDFTGEPVSSLQLPFERLSLRYPNFVETQRKKLQESLQVAQSTQRQRGSGRVQPPGLDLLGRRYESPARATSGNTVHVVVADMDDDKSGLVGLASTREQLIADITRTLGMAEQLQIDINSLGDPDWTVQSNIGTRGSSAPPTRTGGTEPGNVNFIFIDEPLLSDFSEGGTNVTSIKLDTNHSNTSDVGSIHLDHHQPFFLESGNDGFVPVGDDESSLLSTQVDNGD